MKTQTEATSRVNRYTRLMNSLEPAQLINFLAGRQVPDLAMKTLLEGSVRITPLLSDARFLSFFDRPLASVTYPERREVLQEVLLAVKYFLSTPRYRKSTVTLLRRIVAQHRACNQAKDVFKEKYGVHPLDLIVISPSMRCNLRCYGCYAGEYTQADDLPAEVLDRIVDEVREMGIRFIVISGGEPFFNENIQRIWEKNPDLSFLVYTNGTLIDETMAKRLAKMGNVYPGISVEGFEAETDRRRGKGTFARVLKAMENLDREGVLFGYSATAVRNNNELISSPEFVDFFTDRGCMMGWYFNYIPIGRAPDLSMMPTPEQRMARYQHLRELRKTRRILLADFWCDGALVNGCIAGGRTYLHINSNGDVEPCVFAHFAADNIKEKSLAEVLQSPLFRAIRSRQPYSPNLLRPCMIIDNPEVLREVVAEGGAYPTHEGAETIIGPLSGHLNEYASRYADLADPVWAKEHPDEVAKRS